MLFIKENHRGIVFKVLIQPRSSKNVIVGLHGDSLKIKVTAPPVDGAANKMCVKFLARCLTVSPSSLEIITGHNSRTKQILLKSVKTSIPGEENARLKQRIAKLINH